MKETSVIKNRSLLESIFFSNYFYGICAVALSIEASLQQGFPLNGVLYFGLIFLVTVHYYTYPYVRKSKVTNNPRTNWYTKNHNLMRWHQVLCTIILAVAAILFATSHTREIKEVSQVQWILVMIFPLTGIFYYGLNLLPGSFNLRKIGCLKPFIIGFTWAGVVTIYPVLFNSITNGKDYEFNWVGILLFLKNFVFIAVLCIMFDIKDYVSDCLSALKTFVVDYGLRRTIFKLLFPLSIAGLIAFIGYALSHNFHPMRIMLNIIPFILLIVVAFSLRKRKSLLYYLSVVDGLMLIKAFCGTVAITYF